MLPVIPLIAGLTALLGSGTLIWYYRLSESDRQKADHLASGYASELFGKPFDQLSSEEAERVRSLTQRHFN